MTIKGLIHSFFFVTVLCSCGVVNSDEGSDGKIVFPARKDGTAALPALFGTWIPKNQNGHFLKIESDKVTCESTWETDSTYEKGKAVAQASYTENTIDLLGEFKEVDRVSTTSTTRSCMDFLSPIKREWEKESISIRVIYEISNGMLKISRYQEIPKGYAASTMEYMKK